MTSFELPLSDNLCVCALSADAEDFFAADDDDFFSEGILDVIGMVVWMVSPTGRELEVRCLLVAVSTATESAYVTSASANRGVNFANDTRNSTKDDIEWA